MLTTDQIRTMLDAAVHEIYGVTVSLSIQDDGRTLKVFIDGADQ